MAGQTSAMEHYSKEKPRRPGRFISGGTERNSIILGSQGGRRAQVEPRKLNSHSQETKLKNPREKGGEDEYIQHRSETSASHANPTNSPKGVNQTDLIPKPMGFTFTAIDSQTIPSNQNRASPPVPAQLGTAQTNPRDQKTLNSDLNHHSPLNFSPQTLHFPQNPPPQPHNRNQQRTHSLRRENPN